MDSSHHRVFEWNLDFSNPLLGKLYDRDFNLAVVRLSKAALGVIITACICFPIFEHFVSGAKLIDFSYYSALYTIMLWSMLWFPVFYVKQLTSNYAGILASFVFCGMCFIFTLLDYMQTSNYMFDPQDYPIPILLLIIPLVLRLRIKHSIVPCVLSVLFQLALTLLHDGYSLSSKFGYVVASAVSLILHVYCGYFLEKRWKYDFLRRMYVDAEAAKVRWMVARDASLLRNIFPKNLSDELELQMSRKPKRVSPPLDSPRILKALSGLVAVKLQASDRAISAPATPTRKRSNSSPGDLRTPTITPPNFLATPGIASNGTPRAGAPTNGSPKPGAPTNGPPKPLASNISPRPSSPSKTRSPGRRSSLRISYAATDEDPDSASNYSITTPLVAALGTAPETSPSLSISIPGGGGEAQYEAISSPDSLPPIIVLPRVITTPTGTPIAAPPTPDFGLASNRLKRVLYSSGTPLHTPNHQPELQTYLSGTQHADGSIIALSHSYPNVSVIFADIVGFTNLSSTISPQSLVALLNDLFKCFDDIMDHHKLEKIRTVGDAYLCVGNMSLPLHNHEEEAIVAALEMIASVRKLKERNLSLRVGIASGPLIAGVTGIIKWNYDIFGKAFTNATLMETLAPPNCVAVSETIYEACQENKKFNFRHVQGLESFYVIESAENTVEAYLESYLSSSREKVTQDQVALLMLPEEEIMEGTLAEIMELPSSVVSVDLGLPSFAFDISTKFGYTKEELEIERSALNRKPIIWRFKKDWFESDFRMKTFTAVHKYTAYLSMLFAAILFIYMFADLAIFGYIPLASKILFPISAGIQCAYVLFARKYDYHRHASYIASGVALSFGLTFVLVSYLI